VERPNGREPGADRRSADPHRQRAFHSHAARAPAEAEKIEPRLGRPQRRPRGLPAAAPGVTATGRSELVLRLVPRFPLDIAADAGFLVFGDRLSREDGVEGRAKVFAGDRNPIAGPAVVELAAVDESLFAVEEEQV